MIVSAVVAVDLKNGIGANNKLMWHLPADLKFFKTVTMGFPIIMGRKTYESIGRLLPGRRNVIITRNADYKVEGAEVYGSIEEAIDHCKNEEKVFIIGGAEIFKQSMDHLDEIYQTVVKHTFAADTFMDPIDTTKFKKVWSEDHKADEKNTYDYTFERYERI
jgi:dihydrofolate reductase